VEAVSTKQAPGAIGPYSQAIVAGGLVFASGQIALNPETMTLVGTTVEDQTRQVLKNLRAVLQRAGSDLDKVVKTTVFLVDMADFPAMNAEYERAFGTHKPARATVAVKQLPKDARVEIEAIALAE